MTVPIVDVGLEAVETYTAMEVSSVSIQKMRFAMKKRGSTHDPPSSS